MTTSIQTIGVFEVTAHSAKVYGYAFIGYDVEEVGFCYSLCVSPTIDNIKIKCTVASNLFSASLLNLKGNTTYYLKPYLISSNGVQYGSQLEFKTRATMKDLFIRINSKFSKI